MKNGRQVAIVGAYRTKFGELWDKGLRELASEAIIGALDDVQNLSEREIEAAFVGNSSASTFGGQDSVGPLVVDAAGLVPLPVTKIGGTGASGAMALRTAYMAIRSGLYDVVVTCGLEKMTDVTDPEEVNSALAHSIDQEWEARQGLTTTGAFALMARRHFDEFGTTKEHLASVAVKNHANGSKNPKAHFRNMVSPEQVISGKMVADPLGVFDCSPVSDGAAAVVLASDNIAKDLSDTPIWIIGSGQASDYVALHDRDSLYSLNASQLAGKEAFQTASVSRDQISLVEVHDNYTIGEIMAIEDLDLFPQGQGGFATLDGQTALDAETPVNPSGGLKAGGNPLGASGVAQAVEGVIQLRGEAESRQINGAEIALLHSVGGSGALAVCHILARS
ncbi:MAG: thiolase domain-containing protein [Candidatus Hodarchaeales archaeon]|jgi:acetyl-CoA C-acetyltransferase